MLVKINLFHIKYLVIYFIFFQTLDFQKFSQILAYCIFQSYIFQIREFHLFCILFRFIRKKIELKNFNNFYTNIKRIK
jgi:hypothetical protein